MDALTRRESIAAFAGLAAPKQPRIFDAHVHIWSSNITKYPLAPGYHAKDLDPPSFTAEELLKHARPAGVRAINLVQMTWYGLDHSYILDVIRKHSGIFVGTGIVPAYSTAALPSPDLTMLACR
jgi:predicted TIM-barrel fold metal-dependent hydrolase